MCHTYLIAYKMDENDSFFATTKKTLANDTFNDIFMFDSIEIIKFK